MPLYDPGEEHWPVATKIHAGCGGIYLDGYTNVDAIGNLATEHPKLVKRNVTDVRCYYDRLQGTAVKLPKRRETVVDVKHDLLDWLPGVTRWHKVIALQVLEHFTPHQGARLLTQWCSRLYAERGVLVLSVPDMIGTIRLLQLGDKKEREFATRHLEGSARNLYNYHYSWYTEETLGDALLGAGFGHVERLPNIHIYPAVVVRARA